MPDRSKPSIRPQPAVTETPGNRVVPVIEEELTSGRRQVKTGAIRVEKRIIEEAKVIDLPLVREVVDVRRVPKNEIVRSVPATRKVGSTLIIPVVEEEIVISRRLVLKEEIHLIKRRLTERTRRTVPLRKETARVVRLDAAGKVIGTID